MSESSVTLVPFRHAIPPDEDGIIGAVARRSDNRFADFYYEAIGSWRTAELFASNTVENSQQIAPPIFGKSKDLIYEQLCELYPSRWGPHCLRVLLVVNSYPAWRPPEPAEAAEAANNATVEIIRVTSPVTAVVYRQFLYMWVILKQPYVPPACITNDASIKRLLDRTGGFLMINDLRQHWLSPTDSSNPQVRAIQHGVRPCDSFLRVPESDGNGPRMVWFLKPVDGRELYSQYKKNWRDWQRLRPIRFSGKTITDLMELVTPSNWANDHNVERLLRGPKLYYTVGWGHQRATQFNLSVVVSFIKIHKKLNVPYRSVCNGRAGFLAGLVRYVASIEMYMRRAWKQAEASYREDYPTYLTGFLPDAAMDKPLTEAEYVKSNMDVNCTDFSDNLFVCNWLRQMARAHHVTVPPAAVEPVLPSTIRKLAKQKALKRRLRLRELRRLKKQKQTTLAKV